MKTVFLKFKKPFGPYATGDKAGFEAEAAERYLSLGVATRDKDVETTQGAKGASAQPVESAAAAESTALAVAIAKPAAAPEVAVEQGDAAVEGAQTQTAEAEPAAAPNELPKTAKSKVKEAK